MISASLATGWLLWAVIGVGFVILLASLVALFRLHHQALTQNSRVVKLEHDLDLLTNGAVGLGKRLVAIEQDLKATVNHPPQVNPSQLPIVPVAKSSPVVVSRPAFADEQNYSDAVSLLDQGMSTDEVARRCGLSKSEVSLLHLMSGHQSAQDPVG